MDKSKSGVVKIIYCQHSLAIFFGLLSFTLAPLLLGCKPSDTEEPDIVMTIGVANEGDHGKPGTNLKYNYLPMKTAMTNGTIIGEPTTELLDSVANRLHSSKGEFIEVYMPALLTDRTHTILVGHNINNPVVQIGTKGGAYKVLEPGLHEIDILFDSLDDLDHLELAIRKK